MSPVAIMVIAALVIFVLGYLLGQRRQPPPQPITVITNTETVEAPQVQSQQPPLTHLMPAYVPQAHADGVAAYQAYKAQCRES